jgi:hypothetical protein
MFKEVIMGLLREYTGICLQGMGKRKMNVKMTGTVAGIRTGYVLKDLF